MESTTKTGERAVAGITHGLIGPGETVTWKGRHFRFMLSHTSVISGYDMPVFFEDSMSQGMFTSFVHQHFFTATPDGTVMRDELHFSAPLGPLGLIAEKFFLRSYLQKFLIERNEVIRRIAESEEEWKRYIGDELIRR